jgi:hypothetical protein
LTLSGMDWNTDSRSVSASAKMRCRFDDAGGAVWVKPLIAPTPEAEPVSVTSPAAVA